MVISRALGFSPHPPVSDYGTVIVRTPHEVFLGSVVGPLHRIAAADLNFRLNSLTDLPVRQRLRYRTGTTFTRMAYLSASLPEL